MNRMACAAAIVASLGACGRGGDADDAALNGPTRVPVRVATVRRDSLVLTVELTGRLGARPGGSAVLTAPAAGVMSAVLVQVGDQVRRGTLLATEDVPELAADAAQKEAEARVAEQESSRQQDLLAQGITSAREAEAALAASRQAQAAARAAATLLARTRITSPLTGRVQQVSVQRGERVDAGTAIAQVVAVDTLDLMASAPAPDLARLKAGLPAQVQEEGSSTTVAGSVSGVAPGLDSATGTGVVVIRVANAAGHLHPGAGATAHVRVGVRRDALIVPDSAIVLAGDSTVVFIMGADSVAHQRPVARVARSGHDVAVEGRLTAGELVVTTGAFGLEDGMHVVPATGAEP